VRSQPPEESTGSTDGRLGRPLSSSQRRRKRILSYRWALQGLPVFASAKAFSASTAHCTASTALPNSTRTLSQENRGARIDVFANYAISDLMVARPAWADSGLKWFEVFDKVDIAAAQRQAKLNRDVIPQRYGVASVLLNELHREFEPPAPPKPNRKAEAAAARATRDAALLARIESRLELGRKLVALRDATPSHRKFGRAVRKQGFHDPQDVAEMQRWSGCTETGRTSPGEFGAGMCWLRCRVRCYRSRRGGSSRLGSWPART
jgi:hypothetical protein